MKKIYLFFALFISIFSCPLWADVNLEPLLDKVTLQFQAEQWVTTKTALVNVTIHAAVTDQGIDKIQADVMQKLEQLSNKDEWHIVSFNRQEDKSGLESVQITAQARLPQTELANLRNKAKAISKPGVTFTLDSVQFIPSDAEIEQANISLRNKLYQQTKNEIDLLNKMYPNQKYYLHQLDFLAAPPAPMPMAQNAMYMKAEAAAPPLSVGNKVQLQATAVLASMPAAVIDKLSHP